MEYSILKVPTSLLSNISYFTDEQIETRKIKCLIHGNTIVIFYLKVSGFRFSYLYTIPIFNISIILSFSSNLTPS